MKSTIFTQLFRFTLVGAAAFVVDAGVLYATLSFLGYYGGRALSYVCATVTAWYLNRRFTFKPQHAAGKTEWLRYAVFNLGGFAVNYGTYVLCLHAHTLFMQYPVLAVGAGSVAGLFVNFAINKFFVFK